MRGSPSQAHGPSASSKSRACMTELRVPYAACREVRGVAGAAWNQTHFLVPEVGSVPIHNEQGWAGQQGCGQGALPAPVAPDSLLAHLV